MVAWSLPPVERDACVALSLPPVERGTCVVAWSLPSVEQWR